MALATATTNDKTRDVVPHENLSPDQRMIKQMEEISIDKVYERILDVFLEETEDINKCKYNQLVTKENIQEILYKDPE